MDLKATLSAMLDALDDNVFETARADLESLIEWRSKVFPELFREGH